MPPRRISLSEVGRQNIHYSGTEQIVIKNALNATKAGLLRLGTLRSNGAARRRQLKDQIYRYKVALAPYKNVPKEIWMYIFELYCQSGRLSTCDTKHSAVVLVQVCSAWRQIVLSMQKLWSDVYLGQDVNLARIWLERAGNIPRSLETSTPRPRCSYSIPRTIENFICSFPFRKLHISQCDAACIDFTAIPVESLLLLEDLALLDPTWNILNPISFSPHQLPNLVSLRVDTNIMHCFHATRPFTTWKKLRVLRLKCELNIAKFSEILRDASSVEDCSLCLGLMSYYNQDSTENAVIANLKILRLFFSYSSSLWSFLGHFTFPNLDTLVLTSYDCIEFQTSDRSALQRLVPHIGMLKSLNIDYRYRRIDVAFVLECLPLLQVLKLHCRGITTHTAEKIGRGELGGCLREFCDWRLGRNLYQLLLACELRRDITQSQSPNSLGAIARLEKVSVVHLKNVTDFKPRVRKLRKDGIEFKVIRLDIPRRDEYLMQRYLGRNI